MGRPVTQVSSDATTFWVGVVEHHLVEVVTDIVVFRVPHAVLEVDQGDFSCISKGAEDIVFLTIVMA